MIKASRIVLILLSAAAVSATAALAGRQPASANESVDASLKSVLEAENARDVMKVRSEIVAAESSRVQVIQDSIDASVSESESVEESVSMSESESWAERVAVVQARASSIEESMSESASESVSVEESIQASIAESEAIAASEQASLEESKREESSAEESRIAEEQRRAEEERQAAALASQAAAQAPSETPAPETQQVAEETAPPETAPPETAPPAPATSGVTVLIGDSRTYGFEAYGLYPGNLVFWTMNPVTLGDGNVQAAAALVPAKAVFLNGVDDILNYGAGGAIGNYEGYIAAFQSMSPNTQIYVGAVVASTDPRLGEIPTWNALVADMCARRGWGYIDASGGVSPGAGDGIHFDGPNTQVWLNNIRAMAGF